MVELVAGALLFGLAGAVSVCLVSELLLELCSDILVGGGAAAGVAGAAAGADAAAGDCWQPASIRPIAVTARIGMYPKIKGFVVIGFPLGLRWPELRAIDRHVVGQ